MNPYIYHITLYDLATIGTLFPGLTLALLLLLSGKRTGQLDKLFLSAVLAITVLKTGGLSSFFLPALGPMLYFYVRKLTCSEWRLSRKNFLHFCPLLVAFWVPGWLALISVISYLYLSHRLIQDFYSRLKPVLMDRPRFAFKQLDRMLCLLSLLCILSIFNDIFWFTIAFALIGMAVNAVLKPDNGTQLTMPITDRSDAKEKVRRLKEAVVANRLYEDAEITLTTLAVKLNIHPHDLSRIINIGLEKNFSDFINEFRVREIARKMQDPASDRLTLLGIAFEAGFNSKTTFNRVFKEMTGKTPVEYKNSLKKEVPIDKLAPQLTIRLVILRKESPPDWASETSKRNIMIQNYLKIAWRTIIRNKSYSAINIAGLTVGIAACLLIFVVIQYELSFDTYQPGYKSTYRIVTKHDRAGSTTYSDGVAAPAVDAFRLLFPQAKVAGIDAIYGSQIVAPSARGNPGGDKKFIEKTGIMFAEPQLFDVFTVSWLAGSQAVLKDPNMVVIDKSEAEKYFGDWHLAVGKTLKMDNLVTLKVAGVIQDVPSNTDLPLKVVVSYITWKQNAKNYSYVADWGETSSNYQLYLRFPAAISQSVLDKQMLSFSDKQFDNKNRVGRKKYLLAQPLADLHFNNRYGNSLGDHITNTATLRTLSLIAALIIIMAAINFINLSTAQSVGRSKEVGIRKVMGGTRQQLIGQIMGETAIIVLLSAGLALGVAQLALPLLKNIASVPATIGLFNTGSMLCLAGVIITVTILSGVYPALIVSGFKPVTALKNKINAAAVGGISLRRILVVTQFAISQLLIIGTVIAVKQMDFVNNADLGFNKDAVLVIPCSTDSVGLLRINSFKQQVLAVPGVKAASFASDVPSSDNNNSTSFNFNHSDKDPGFNVFLKTADADYFKTFGLRFVSGHGYDQSDTARQVVINETLMQKLGIVNAQEALGKTISIDNNRWLPIVGVVADFKTNSMREEVKPLAIYPQKLSEQEIAVNIRAGQLPKTVAALQRLWGSTYPEYAYNGFFLDDSIAKFYKQENQLELIYKIFSLIAIFISCLGLYGLVSFMAVQRTREVGIRKVLGASIGSIVYMFSKEFIALIVIAFLLSAPAAWYLTNSWLQTFAFRISPGVWTFAGAVLSSLLIGWLTVGYKAIRAALANPVKSLRSE